MSIEENYISIQQRIQNACLRVGRNRDEVKLIVVTKLQPPEKINKVIKAGAFRLGENYPEQLNEKIAEIDQYPAHEWHMIGHIQSRKIKYIVQYFSMVHSLDQLDSAIKLNDACKKTGIQMPVCIEVNIAGEDSKNGIDAIDEGNWQAVCDFVKRISELENIHPIGLMTMPPFVVEGERNRIYFRRCRKLFDFINQNISLRGFTELSMGTSSDFEVAIEEGATYVRIGEAIMGPREI